MNRRAVLVGIAGLLLASLFPLNLLMTNNWNPTVPIRFGEAFTQQNQYAESLLGEVVLTQSGGHDGKFFFSQAMDPFYLEPDEHSIYLDRPTYRAQRMLYPTLASLGGFLSPPATAWGLILVNVLAMGVGTAYTALLAVEMGLSRWFGIAFVLNPGLLAALNVDGAGIMASAGLMAGVYFVTRERIPSAAIALTLAALSRETMLLAVFGLALFWIWKKRRIPWPMAAPLIAVAAWWLYVHWRLDDGLAQDTQALGPPLAGFLGAFETWLSTPGSGIDLATGVALLLVSLAVLVRSTASPTELGWAVSGFALLGLFMSEPVWERYFDASRALAPVITAYVLLVPATGKRRQRIAVSVGS